MLDIKYIKDNKELIKEAAKNKNINIDIDKVVELSNEIVSINKELDDLKTERNTISKSIPKLSNEEKVEKIQYVKELKEKISEKEELLSPVKEEYDNLMLRVPGVPLDEVPIGETDEDNVEIKKVGDIPKFNFEIKDHVSLSEDLDLIDMKRASKVAGSRSYYLKNEAVILEMALTRYVLDKLRSKGFTPMNVPVIVRQDAMKGTGYFPVGIEQAYHIKEDDLYLVGTSEVSLVSYHSDEFIEKEELPKMYAGYSSCFRREAGTYGKDTRGLYRVHQFTKIEQVVICEADEDKQYEIHNMLLANAEEIMQELKIPYRVVKVCTGDMGQGQVRKHDIEAWMPSREKYSETHSCSSFRDFQTRRSNIKYKDGDENKFCYTLNNTAIASPRILIPLLELNQNEDGSINIPEVLIPYMGMNKIERKN